MEASFYEVGESFTSEITKKTTSKKVLYFKLKRETCIKGIFDEFDNVATEEHKKNYPNEYDLFLKSKELKILPVKGKGAKEPKPVIEDKPIDEGEK